MPWILSMTSFYFVIIDLTIRSLVLSMRMLFRKVVLRIRIRMFLSLLDPDPVVRGMDPV
jgi:hypothetical protein